MFASFLKSKPEINEINADADILVHLCLSLAVCEK
jgi:hypothetical protein